MPREKRNKIVCFSTTQSQFDALSKQAPTKDSLSALLREIIDLYLKSKADKEQ